MRLRELIRERAVSLLRSVGSRLGYDLVPRGVYSVVVPPDELEDQLFSRRSPLEGLDFDAAKQLAFARRYLGPFVGEIDGALGAWHPDTEAFGAVDGEILYAMIRHLKPARVVELGAGYSTHVIAAASRVNAQEGAGPRFSVFEPYPSDVVTGGIAGVDELCACRAQEVPDRVFRDLRDRDVLFVDTTHTVKIGGDVNRVVLDVLPALAPGVVVHFHDIFLPGEYHRAWIEHGWHWAEQYLVQAFLCLNPEFEVLWGSAAVWLDHREELRQLVPTLRDHRPSSLWIRRAPPRRP